MSLIYYYITLTGTANLGVSLRCGRMQRGCLRVLAILEFYGGPGLRAFISADVVPCGSFWDLWMLRASASTKMQIVSEEMSPGT